MLSLCVVDVQTQHPLVLVDFAVLSDHEHVFLRYQMLNHLLHRARCLFSTLQWSPCRILLHFQSLHEAIHYFSLAHWLNACFILDWFDTLSDQKGDLLILIVGDLNFSAWLSLLSLGLRHALLTSLSIVGEKIIALVYDLIFKNSFVSHFI